MYVRPLRLGLVCGCLLLLLVIGAVSSQLTHAEQAGNGTSPEGDGEVHQQANALKVHYLEIVTSSVDQTCAAMEKAHGVVFGDPVSQLGNARTAKLAHGGLLGVRAPMRDTEAPVVRPYVLVRDIDAALQAAEASGAEVAMWPMTIPGRGKFAIYILGGIDHGLWQL